MNTRRPGERKSSSTGSSVLVVKPCRGECHQQIRRLGCLLEAELSPLEPDTGIPVGAREPLIVRSTEHRRVSQRCCALPVLIESPLIGADPVARSRSVWSAWAWATARASPAVAENVGLDACALPIGGSSTIDRTSHRHPDRGRTAAHREFRPHLHRPRSAHQRSLPVSTPGIGRRVLQRRRTCRRWSEYKEAPWAVAYPAATARSRNGPYSCRRGTPCRTGAPVGQRNSPRRSAWHRDCRHGSSARSMMMASVLARNCMAAESVSPDRSGD